MLSMPSLEKLNPRIFAITLFIPLLILGFTVFHNGPNSGVTALTYFGFLGCALFLIRKQITVRDIVVLVGVYSFLMLNLMLFPSTTEYYTSIVMILVMTFYLPICAFVVRHIKHWENLFDAIKPCAIGSVLIGSYIVFFSEKNNYEDWFTYMEFSYCMLPFTTSMYITFRKQKSIIWFALFLVDASCMILYGARATTMFLVLFILAFEYLNAKSVAKIYILVIFGIIALAITVFFDNILMYLSTVDALKDSRFVAKAIAGELSDGGERDMLVDQCIHQLGKMNLEIPGLFGDRAVITGVYPHNIFLEILMQFGIIPGICVLLWFGYMIYVGIFRYEHPIITIYLCCALISRYLISGSYIQEGTFWLWLFCMVNIFGQRRRFKLPAGRIHNPPTISQSING